MKRLKRIYHTETNGWTERLDTWRPGTSLIFDGRRFLATHAYWATRATTKPKGVFNRRVQELLPEGERGQYVSLDSWSRGWQVRALKGFGYTDEQILRHRITTRLMGR